MDRLCDCAYANAEGLPRLRGDGPVLHNRVYGPRRAAPPTRGWTPQAAGRIMVQCGCPAYAGMDPSGQEAAQEDRRLPRLRGDGPHEDAVARVSTAAAPPTRGWTRKAALSGSKWDGCPAYAGMDPNRTCRLLAGKGLPRLRGDGPCCHCPATLRKPAAPPTRGWTLDKLRTAPLRPGCPAYAGMDPH